MKDKMTTNAEYVYSNKTCWELRRYSYDIEWWETEDLPDYCFVICSILKMNGCMTKIALGELLGFAMREVRDGDYIKVYRDKNEIQLFEDILRKVEKERLIRITNQDLVLTNLGEIALEERKLYHFHKGLEYSFEHAQLTKGNGDEITLFPYRKDMGIESSINSNNKLYWPNDDEVKDIIYRDPDSIMVHLSEQMEKPLHIYKAERLEYFEWDHRYINIDLFQQNSKYFAVVKRGDEIAKQATQLLALEENKRERERIILECLFQKLWNDPNAVLDYDALYPYERFINYELLTKDKRVVWTDDRLFEMMTDGASAECWENISENCVISVIEEKLSEHVEYWNWPKLSVRLSDDFLIKNFNQYPWSLDTISSDKERSIETIEKLILIPINTEDNEETWNWEELGDRLRTDFVWEHLDLVDVNLRKFTEDTAKCKTAIIKYPDRLWDWKKVESTFALDFIVSHIQVIGAHLKYSTLFDRILQSEDNNEHYLYTPGFEESIRANIDAGGSASYINLNEKDYHWTVENIRLLTKLSLITWESTQTKLGFECNPSLVWSKEIFQNFSKHIVTEDGYNTVSSAIEDVSLIIENPDFNWKWDAISCNPNLINNEKLYQHFNEQLNWNIVLRSVDDIALIEQIANIDHYIEGNAPAWTLLSEIVTVPTYIQQHRNYPWDWAVLTERMYPSLKLSGLSHPDYVDKWNWTYLSETLSDSFLNENLKTFRDHWNWDVVCHRLLANKETKVNVDYIDTLVPTFNAIQSEEKRLEAWQAFTSCYTFDELKKLMASTKERGTYAWNMAYFCSQPDFKIPEDLNECADFLDWDALSSSNYVGRQFAYNKGRGLTPKAWGDKVREWLGNSEYHWNYQMLSHMDSLYNQQWFLSKYADQVDWEFVCAKSLVFAIKDKAKFSEVLNRYKAHIVIPVLANREDINLEQLMKLFPEVEYDYNALMEMGKWFATEEIITAQPNYPWDWTLVCSCKTFSPSEDFLQSNQYKPLDWGTLSSRDLPAWRSGKLITSLSSNSIAREGIDWENLSSEEWFPINKQIIINLHDEELNWKKISGKKDIKYLLEYCGDKVDWRIISGKEWFISTSDNDWDESVENLRIFKNMLDWHAITERCWRRMDTEFLSEFEDFVDWNILSEKDIPYTKTMIEAFKDRWNWAALKRNRAYYNNEELVGREPKSKANIALFVKKFGHTPKAYHFAHMSNAVKIINDMKIQSRNSAEGKFENSAGNNVHITSKAHGFARFYFRPQSPTQYHNEFLGRDKDMTNYDKYCGLGRPKCPLPVFFVFDVEEVLMAMPDKCFYSNGNMQARATSMYKVIDDPNRINTAGLSIGEFQAKQQEFLVKDELDFSRLSSVRICCYNEFHKRMLQEAIKGSPWEDKIEVDETLYIGRNKELIFEQKEDRISISSNLIDEHVYKVVYFTSMPEIKNPNNVVTERGNEIIFREAIDIRRTVPFRVYFESTYGNKKWLIYNNK